MSSANGTAEGVPPPQSSSSSTFNPSMAIIIVVLIGACLLVAIFSMYIRRCTQGDDRAVSRRNGNQSVHFFDRPGEGLERAIIDSLPTVSFSVVKTLKAGKEDLECAVCLEMFEDDESLRLLPKCSHVFHTECIDEWFLSHSTCPLCRTSLKPTPEEIDAGVPAVGEVSRRILEAQEELFGSARNDYSDSVVDENEVFDGSSREVGRDMERNSARLALFRNSDSFRQAARGVEVRERLASLSARYPSSSTSSDIVYKGPQRASSLSCVSLQRTSSAGAEAAFRYGSQRYGAAGSSSLGRLNERELQESTTTTTTTGGDQNHWIQLDIDLDSAAATPPKDIIRHSGPVDSSHPILGKPRSGPQQQQHQHQQGKKARTRSLRGSLLRSASEGRVELSALESSGSLPMATSVEPEGSVTPTLAQRTMQWLSGSNRHSRSSSEHRNGSAV